MPSKSSLDVMWGAFLINGCYPLELWLNWCSASCFYCFGNLNDPDRKANLKQAMGLLANYRDRDSYAGYLLREGYPVVCSNHVDPFAASNDFQALPLIEMMLESGIPFTLQTKGGRRLYDALDLLDRPIVFYFSIATLDEEVAKRVEPGAPSIAERLEMISEITRRGHKVNAGINPVVDVWLPDPQALTDRLAEAGVWGCWVQPMHLSHRQVKNMPEKGREALGEDVIKLALKDKNERNYSIEQRTRAAAKRSGLHSYRGQQGSYSRYFEPYQECYPKRFPLMQDFVNHCYESGKRSGDLVYWKEFRDFFVPKLPAGVWGLRDHINAMVVPQVLYGKHIPQRMTYEQLLWYVWRYKETLYCPANVDCFAWAADHVEGDNWIRIIDEEKNPILVFLPEGTRSAYTDKHSI